MCLFKELLHLQVAGLLILLLNCAGKPSASSISIPFDGSVKTKDGIVPFEDSGKHDYVNFRNRKVLSLKGPETIQYDLSGEQLHQGSLNFWLKLENASDENEATVVSLRTRHDMALKVDHIGRLIHVQFSCKGKDRNVQLLRKLSPSGIWANIVLVWNVESPESDLLSFYLNGQRIVLTESVLKNLEIPDGLILGNSKNPKEFSVLLRDLYVNSRVPSGNEIAASFEADLKKMQTPLKWSAENLEHFAGKKVLAEGSSSGNAWTVDTLFALKDHIQLKGGPAYGLVFRIKPLSPLAPDMIRCQVWKSYSGKNVPLISWANASNDLLAIRKYRTFALDFHAEEGMTAGYAFYSLIPSKYSILLDTVVVQSKNNSWRDVQRAEELEHTVGVWMKDEEAAGGKAWSNANTLLYGPYTSIGQPGRYRVTWRVKIADSAPLNEPLLVLDVYAHDGFLNSGRRGTRSYGKLVLGASEFQKPHVWENKSIDFRYDGADMLEFRAHAKWMNPGSVLLDTVEVRCLERT